MVIKKIGILLLCFATLFMLLFNLPSADVRASNVMQRATFTPVPTIPPPCTSIYPVTSCLTFRVGPAFRVTGPNVYADAPFFAYNTGSGIRGYVSNSSTYRLEGPDMEHLTPNYSSPVIGAGPGGSNGGNFDGCGAWLMSVEQDGSIFRGWYHAEKQCDYTNGGQTHKSAAYAQSSDGLTFSKINYPNNQVLTGTASNIPTPGKQTGEGDISVVKFGSYYYMYYAIQQNPDLSRNGVAQATIASGGVPGAWLKYYNGSFSQPGIGGVSTSVGFLGSSGQANLFQYPGYSTKVAFIGGDAGVTDSQRKGLKLSFSDDGIHFTSLSEPLFLSSEYWGAPPNPSEHVAYPSIVGLTGGKTWGTSGFYLFYMYIEPGGNTGQRFLVRRKVDVLDNAVQGAPRVKVALTRYYSSSRVDHWTTTAMVPDAYLSVVKSYGYVFTRPQPGMIELKDCYIPSWDDHMISNSATECTASNVKTLRTIGWVWSSPQPGTVPLYRCYWQSATNHYVSFNSNCDSTGPDMVTEFILGYVPTS